MATEPAVQNELLAHQRAAANALSAVKLAQHAVALERERNAYRTALEFIGIESEDKTTRQLAGQVLDGWNVGAKAGTRWKDD